MIDSKQLEEWKSLATNEPSCPWGSVEVLKLIAEIERLQDELEDAQCEAARYSDLLFAG